MRLRRGELRPSPSPLRRLLRQPGRQTNQARLVVLLFAFGTGVATVAIGSPNGAWVAVGHGICGMAVVLLIPWKSRVVRGGLRRARLSRWLSLLLAVLALFTLIAGLGYATGLVRSIAGKPGLWVHIAVALALVPLVVWHVWARGIRVRGIRPRRNDLSRRALLRGGVLAVGAVGLYTAAEAAISVLVPPGARRRFTGSYEVASFRPEAMPSTSWLLDPVPTVDPDRWRLTIRDGQGRRELTLAELTTYGTQVRATLDCTSGWYSHRTGPACRCARCSTADRERKACTCTRSPATGSVSRSTTWIVCCSPRRWAVLPSRPITGSRCASWSPGGGATGGSSGSTASRYRPHRRGGSRRSPPADAISAARRPGVHLALDERRQHAG